MRMVSMAAEDPARFHERRTQKRFEVVQAASVRTPDGRELSCEIRNFCLGGMFLRMDDVMAVGALQGGDDVEVNFALPASYGTQPFSVKARLARRSADGIGVAFTGTPLEATRALNRVAMAMRTQRIVGQRYQGADGRQLQERCRDLLVRAVERAVRGVYAGIEPRLEQAAAKSGNFAERNAILAAADQIRVHEGAARTGWPRRALEGFEAMYAPRRPEPQSSPKDLSIVQTDEFEDWLNLTGEINRLEDRFAVELAGLVPRIEKLYGRPLDRGNNPFAPAPLMQAAHAEFATLGLSLTVRKILYGTLCEALQEPLEALYGQLDEHLPEASGGAPAAATASAWPGTRATGDDPNADAALFVGGEPVAEHAALPPAAARASGGMAGILMNLLRRALPVSAATGAAVSPRAAVAADVDAATRSPRGMTQATGSETGSVGRIAVASQRMLGELVDSGRIVPAQAAAAQDSADVFGVLAETIENDRSLSGSVKDMLRALEEPLVKLAMLDKEYLDSTGHAAHRVVNVVDRIALASTDDGRINDRKLLQLVQRWIGRIRNEADRNPGIYDEARIQFEKILQPFLRARSQRIARLQAGLEGWQKTGQANRAIGEAIRRRIEGREVPGVLLEFFNPGWRNYLIRVILRHGAGSPEESEA